MLRTKFSLFITILKGLYNVLKRGVAVTLSALQIQAKGFANSADQNEVARNEPSNQDIHCHSVFVAPALASRCDGDVRFFVRPTFIFCVNRSGRVHLSIT